MAATNGRVEIIEYLIKEHDPTLIDATMLVHTHMLLCACLLYRIYFKGGMKPIHFSSIRGNINTLKVLIKLGSDPRSPAQDDV